MELTMIELMKYIDIKKIDFSKNPNSITTIRLGLYYIKFIGDRTIFKIRIHDIIIRGITIGDR